VARKSPTNNELPKRRRILPILLTPLRSTTRARMQPPPPQGVPATKSDFTGFGTALARLIRSRDATPPSGIAAILPDTSYDKLGGALLKITRNDAPVSSIVPSDAASEAASGGSALLRLAAKTALATGLLAALGIGAAVSLVSGAQSATSNRVSGNLAPQIATARNGSLPNQDPLATPLAPASQPGDTPAPNPAQDATAADPGPASTVTATSGTTAATPQQTTGAATRTGPNDSLPGAAPTFADPNSADSSLSYPSFGNLIAANGPSTSAYNPGTDLRSPTNGTFDFALAAPPSFITAAASSPTSTTAPITAATNPIPAGNGSVTSSGNPTDPNTTTPSSPATPATASNSSQPAPNAATPAANTPVSSNPDNASPSDATPAAATPPDSNPPVSSTPGTASDGLTDPMDGTTPVLAGILPPAVTLPVTPPGTTASSLSQPVDIPEPASLLLLAIVSAGNCLLHPRRPPAPPPP
jgi:hypothetical protein